MKVLKMCMPIFRAKAPNNNFLDMHAWVLLQLKMADIKLQKTADEWGVLK